MTPGKSRDGLPNHWNPLNLRESPYFQSTLGEAARPARRFSFRRQPSNT